MLCSFCQGCHSVSLKGKFAAGKPFWKEAGVEDKIELHIGDGVETLEKLSKVTSNRCKSSADPDHDSEPFSSQITHPGQLMR